MAKATRPNITDVLLKKGLLGEKDAEETRENHGNNGKTPLIPLRNSGE